MQTRKHGVTAALMVVLIGCLATVDTGSATGKSRHVQDGQIVFGVFDPNIDDVAAVTVNPDGSHPRQISDNFMECPHWSPDGTQIASCGAPAPYAATVVNVDTGAVRFLPSVATDLSAGCYVWSSDGKRMACEGLNDEDPTHDGLFTARARDMSDARRITTNNGGDDIPGDYSPSSKQLVFERDFADEDASPAIYRVNANGTGLRRLTPSSLIVGSPGSWSLKGNQILFSARTDFDHRQTLWVEQANGTHLHPLAVDGIPCGGSFDDPDSLGCTNPVWSPTGRQMVFRVNSATDSVVTRANADGSRPSSVGLAGGDNVDWGTHPLATGP